MPVSRNRGKVRKFFAKVANMFTVTTKSNAKEVLGNIQRERDIIKANPITIERTTESKGYIKDRNRKQYRIRQHSKGIRGK